MPDLFALEFVRSALLVTIIMGLLLAYLGTHVVGRGIVFVDLALGQISMLGVAVAAYLELEPTTVSMVFTLVGALLMSFIKVTDKRLKQEAIIGILYAVSSALTVLLISKAAHGSLAQALGRRAHPRLDLTQPTQGQGFRGPQRKCRLLYPHRHP